MKITEHFDAKEFLCKCGCGKSTISTELVNKLEKLHYLMDAKAVYITSGYRCSNYSPKVGGYSTDAHTKGIASDIQVLRKNGAFYSAFDIAEAAERLGFSGIGIIDNVTCHVDIRNSSNYSNSHWFGNEKSNENYSTFQRGTIFPNENKSNSITVTIEINGEKYKGTLNKI